MASKEDRATLFLHNAKEKYGDLYDYSKVQYDNNRTKVTIICSKHGDFSVTPGNFLSRDRGCPYCGREASKQKRRDSYHAKRVVEGCGTDQFNVRGGTKKHKDLVLKVFK